MYINKSRSILPMTIWGILFVFSFTMGLAFFAIGVENAREPGMLFMFIGLAVGCLILVIGSVKTFFNLLSLVILNNLLCSDEDGIVPCDEIASYLHTTKLKLNRTLDYGERKRILINVVRDVANDRLVLTDKITPSRKTSERPFVGISCPGCASPLKLRAGSTGVCPICGREVTAPDIIVG